MTAVLYILLALAGLFLLLEFILYLAAFQGKTAADFTKKNFKMKPELRKYSDDILSGVRYVNETPCERVTVKSRDGLRLSGRFYDAPDRRGVVIMCHGYRSLAENDFSCSSEYIHNLGYAMLLVDERAHGKSGGMVITFGVRERWDVVEWAKYVSARFPNEPIILEGLSMGASTVIMAAGEELPESVVGVMADCGYTSPREIIYHVIRDTFRFPVSIFYPLTRLAGIIFGGFDIEECSATEAAKCARLPALFIHGEADDFVPCDMGRANYEAWAGPKTLLTVPNAGHGVSYLVDTPRCRSAIQTFLDSLPTKFK